MQNGFFHLYQLDKSIFNLSAVGWYLSLKKKKKKKKKKNDRAVWKRSVENLIRCHTPQCLIWVCTACPARMFQVNIIIFFIAKVTVSFFLSDVKRPWLHVGNFFMHFCRLLMYLFYLFFFVFLKNIFFSRWNQNKKNQTASIQSRPDIICPAWSGSKLYVDVISWQ